MEAGDTNAATLTGEPDFVGEGWRFGGDTGGVGKSAPRRCSPAALPRFVARAAALAIMDVK